MVFSPTFCPLPWVKLSVSPEGHLRPCCTAKIFRKSDGAPVVARDLDQLWNDEMLRELRKTMLAGKWPKQCSYCHVQEQNGVDSQRKIQLQYWDINHKPDWSDLLEKTGDDGHLDVTPLGVDLRLTAICNLKCVMCKPQSSSSWEPTSKRILARMKELNFSGKGFSSFITVTETGDRHWGDRQPVVDWILRLSPRLKLIQLAGGEPLLFKSHESLLKGLIENQRAKDITLEYNTNGTLVTDEMIGLWKNFKSVVLQISVDGVGKEYEYIRTPAQWSVLTSNVQRLVNEKNRNWQIRFIFSIQLLNAGSIPRFLQWLTELDPDWITERLKRHIVFSVVGSPAAFNPASLPESVKSEILDELKTSLRKLADSGHPLAASMSIAELLPIMKQALKVGRGLGTSTVGESLEYLRLLDEEHGKSWRDSFPWLAERLKPEIGGELHESWQSNP